MRPLSQLTPSELQSLKRLIESGQLPETSLNQIAASLGLPTIGSHRLTDEEVTLQLPMEASLHEFITHAWPIIEPTTNFIDGWHLHCMCEHLEALAAGEIPNLLINVPPGTMKSLCTSVFFLPWVWTTRPETRFFYASYDQALSTRDSVRSRSILQSEWYQRYWGSRFELVGDQNEKTRFNNDKQGWRIATSVGGRGTGEHPDLIISDDPHNTKRAESEVDRQGVLDWWKNVIASRGVIRGVRKAVIMQRVHEDDLSNHIIKEMESGEAWVHLCLPMRYEPGRMKTTVLGWSDKREETGVELLWPEAYDEAKVAGMEREMGSLTAAGQLQQRPAPAGGFIFKREWYEVLDNVPSTADKGSVRYWDLAGSVTDTADYTSGAKLVDMGDYILIDDLVVGKWSSFARDEVIKQTAQRDGVECTIVIEQEPGSSGMTVIAHYVRMLAGFAVYADKVGRNKSVRATPFASYSEARMVKIRRAEWNSLLLDQLEVFPNGKHDDVVDSLSGAFTYIAGGNSVPLPSELLASGSDPEEKQPLTQEEIEELPADLRELVEASRQLAAERDDEDYGGWG